MYDPGVPRSHFAAYLLIAAAVGYLAAVFVERSRPTPARPSAGGQAVAAENAGPAGPAARPPAPGLSEAERAVEAGDWTTAVAAIRTLIASGPDAWDDAAALVLAILAVDDPVEYTLREAELDPLASEIAFHRHAVPLARATGTVGAELYLELAFAWLGEAGEGAFLVECLEDASDEEAARILHALGGNVTPALLPKILARLRAETRLQAQSLYLRAIASSPAVAESALRDLAAGPNRVPAELASAALQMIRPPVTGFLVLGVPSRDDPRMGTRPRPGGSLQRGDIVTAVEGKAIAGEADWKAALQGAGGRGPVTLTLLRRGQDSELRVPGPLAGIKGRFVTKGESLKWDGR